MVAAVSAVVPERFGRYVLLDRIGEGGMAEVFRAINPGAEGFKRTLVVKRILGRLSKSAEFVEMFVREAQIGAMLNHPNIAQVYDFGSVDGHYFLVMEYLRGRDVLAIIRRLIDTQRPFPIPVAAFIAHEVARSLAYAHALTGPDGRSLNIIHRDVTPSNVMCLREGGVKLLDFGIAKAVEEVIPEHTEQGTFKGKLTYMAPERLRNVPLDGRSDLYSLGVVLWEMLTCHRLFRGKSEVEIFKNVLEMPVPPPSSLRPDVPANLDTIVMRALERDPDKRYATGQAFADDLEEVLRETKFKTRMLPKLLVEAFGSGVHSSQIALSCLTPELLAAASLSNNPATGIGLGSTGAPVARMPHWNSWRLWAVIGTTIAVAGLAGLLASRRMYTKSETQPVSATEPQPRAPGSVPTPPPRTLDPLPETKASGNDRAPIRDEAAFATKSGSAVAPKARTRAGAIKGKKNISGRKPARLPTGPVNSIGSGLSIDPFVEAAARGIR